VLPALFWEERRMAEAASVARKLRALTSEAESALQRTRLAGDAAAAAGAAAGAVGAGAGAAAAGGERTAAAGFFPSPSVLSMGGSGGGSAMVAPRGSLEYCTRRLAEYCAWLEGRVVARFDRAFEDDNLRLMAECARIMAAFEMETVVVQRYISLLPAFQTPLDSLPWLREPAVAADDAVVAERLRPLSRLYGTLGETVEIEAARMSSVFPSPRAALQLLATRVFQDRVRLALDRLLEDTAEDAFSRSTSFSSAADELLELEQEGSEGSEGEGLMGRGRRVSNSRGDQEEVEKGKRRHGGEDKDDEDDDDEDEDEDYNSSGSGSYDDEGTDDGGGSEVEDGSSQGAAAADARRRQRRQRQRRREQQQRRLRSTAPSKAIHAAASGGGGGGGGGGYPRRHSHSSYEGGRRGGGGRGGGRGGGGDGDVYGSGRDDGDDGGGGPSVLALHLYLRLLAGAYDKTRELAERVSSACSGCVSVAPLLSAAFERALQLYPAPELQWLDLMAERELAPEFESPDPARRPP
ncbi:hypothetical protein Agub_g9839, partial [Astrephomene gubernaculifera]